MAVPSTFADLSATPASNSGLISDASAVNSVDDHLRSVYAFIASVYANSGNGWASPYLSTSNPSYTGTLTGGAGVVNLGSGQFYKDASGNVGIGGVPANRLDVFHTVTGIGSRVRNSATGVELAIRTDATTAGIDAGNASDGLTLSINTVTKVRIDTAGNVLIANTSGAPSTPASGGVLYVQAGALKYIGSSGTVTVLAPA